MDETAKTIWALSRMKKQLDLVDEIYEKRKHHLDGSHENDVEIFKDGINAAIQVLGIMDQKELLTKFAEMIQSNTAHLSLTPDEWVKLFLDD